MDCVPCLDSGQYDDDRDPATPCSDTDICVQICGAGTQDDDCNEETACVDCVAGQYAAGGLAFPASRCVACSAGKTDDDSAPDTPCVSCSPGFYAEAGNFDVCIGCSLGRFAPTSGGTSDAACEACREGQYAAVASSSCDFCSSGRADEDADATTECTACAAGTYAGCGETECRECVPGQVDSDATSATPCTACLAGQYWDDATNSTSLASCVQCLPGKADADADSTTACEDCDVGTFCPAGAFDIIVCVDLGEDDLDSDPSTPCTAAKRNNVAVHASITLAGDINMLPDNFENVFALDMAAIAAVEPSRIAVENVLAGSSSHAGRRMQSGLVVVEFMIAPAPDGLSIPVTIIQTAFDVDGVTVGGLSSLGLSAVRMDEFVCTQACDAGTVDHDCKNTTACVACSSGEHSAGGESPAGLCIRCGVGSTDHDGDPRTACIVCTAGTYTDSVAHHGPCIGCEAGRYSPNAGATSIELCEECKRGQYSDAAADECEVAVLFFSCPDAPRQISDFDRLKVERKGCSCNEGWYDAASIEVRCWEMGLKDDVRSDMLNKKSWLDIDMHNSLEGLNRVNDWDSTCVECPDCLDCSGGSSDWSDIKIKEGYGLVAESVPNRTHFGRLSGAELTYLDVFKCPLEGACLADLTMADILQGRNRACGTGYDGASTSPLCATCDEGYTRRGRECSPCDEMQGGSIAIVVVMVLALIFGVLSTMRLRSCAYHFQVGAALLRLMWPRINQSANLLITNYQILSGLPGRVRISFPAGITTVLRAMTTLVSIDILNLPGLSCLVGSSFYIKFLSNMLTPFVIVVGLHLLSRWHINRLRTVTMPMPPELDVEPDSVGPKGSKERSSLLRRSINFKICRAVVASKIQAPYYAGICFIVFIRFPAVTRMIFAMFRCRRVADVPSSVSLLEAAYEEECFEGDHKLFFALGVFFLFAYTLSIPAWLLYRLNSYKDTIIGQPASSDFRPAFGVEGERGYRAQVGTAAIPGNPNYIEIAPFKPLFQFNKPNCYMFEIFFWIEKVLLVGFTELLASSIQDNTGIAQWLLNVSFTLFFLVLIAKYEPQLEPRYNTGQVLMHVFIICFFIVSLLLNPRLDIKDSAVDNLEIVDNCLIASQIMLVLYLVLVSFEKMAQLWEQAKAQVEAELKAEQLIKDHIKDTIGPCDHGCHPHPCGHNDLQTELMMKHFNSVRLNFSDNVAIMVTKFNTMGGELKQEVRGIKETVDSGVDRMQTVLSGEKSKREIEAEFVNPIARETEAEKIFEMEAEEEEEEEEEAGTTKSGDDDEEVAT